MQSFLCKNPDASDQYETNRFQKVSIKKGINEALKQIEDMKYEEEVLNIGVENIIKLAIVFKGKEVKIT